VVGLFGCDCVSLVKWLDFLDVTMCLWLSGWTFWM